MSFDVYLDSHASVLKLCNEFAIANSLNVFDFDAHTSSETFPNDDLIGPYMFALSEDEGTFTVETMIGISTVTDVNLFKLRPLIGSLYTRLRPNKTFKLYSVTLGSPYGVMKIMNGTSISPVARTNDRPVQFIAVQASTEQKMLVP